MLENLIGSEALRNSLPYGAIKKMAVAFGNADTWISKVVAGRQNGKVAILECAVRISKLQVKNNIELHEILKDYGTINETRN
tara:strand:- start:499 stop:744 length:246 start_codon:yes stop_codon:yes gene_type:complete